jgi:putative N6-adenine-specific DNA methylase
MFEMIAKTLQGLEPILAQELTALGAKRVEIHNRAVRFFGDDDLLYRANLWLRTAIRIMLPIEGMRIRNEHELYETMLRVQWDKYMSAQDTFAIDAAVHSSYFNHSQYVALKTKDALADWWRKKVGYRPSVDVENPRVRFNVHIFEDEMTLSLDSSGESLHQRGYRLDRNEAPLNEVLAAGMIQLSGWKGDTAFADPMCGSGTLPIEAAMIAANIAPNLQRASFGFMNWKNYDERLFRSLVAEAKQMQKPLAVPIVGSDISDRNIYYAKENIERAGLTDQISLRVCSIEESVAPAAEGTLICNPPYGERMMPADIDELYGTIGDAFKQKYSGWTAWMISSNMEAFKKVGLRASQKILLLNAKLPCQLRRFDLYKGSKVKPAENAE